jgi:hypothetical protein
MVTSPNTPWLIEGVGVAGAGVSEARGGGCVGGELVTDARGATVSVTEGTAVAEAAGVDVGT